MKMKTLYLAIATALAMPAVAMAAPPAAADKKVAPARELTAAEVAILAHRHHVNVMEGEMGKLAQKNGGAAVKKYGAMLVKEHGDADKKAMALAKARKVTLTDHPTDAMPEEKAAHDQMMERMAKLKTLTGDAFDREFSPAMVEGHEKEFTRVSGEVGTVSDPDLKVLLENTLPSLRKHADLAKKLPHGDKAAAPPAPGTVTPRPDAAPSTPKQDPASPTKPSTPSAPPPTKPAPPSTTKPQPPGQAPVTPKAQGQQSRAPVDPSRDLITVLK